MFVRKNKNNKTGFVGNVTPAGLGVFYSVPLRGSKKGQLLTLKFAGNRIDMTGSQVRVLKKVLARASRLSK